MAKFLRFVFWTALVIGVIIGGLRLTTLRWWQVPLDDPYLAASISPTLHAGDWILLWRATEPNYGDLVVCPEPKAPQRVVLGRIVGEARDNVKIVGGDVSINARPLATDSSCPRFHERDPSSHELVEQSCDEETVGGVTHDRGNVPAELLKSFETQAEVPTAEVFLISDNRLFPYDSRDYGPVARPSCKETVVFRLVSKDGYFDAPNRLTLIH